jgi:ferric-dicitrate binding protein FerR (iron transport regulator)
MEDFDGTLLMKYANNTADSKERHEVEAWLGRDVGNEDILLDIARMCHAHDTWKTIGECDPYSALNKVRGRVKTSARRLLFRRVAVAASFVVGILGIGSFLAQLGNGEQTSPTQLITVTTNPGVRTHLTLPDGTEVDLNAGSTLVYPSRYDKRERRVQLTGEAYFDVASRPDQPFTVGVCNDRLTVTALGTEFNLQAYERDDAVETILVEGGVRLGVRGKERTITMLPSEKATYDLKTDMVSVNTMNPAQEIAWKEGVLIFRRTPLSGVLKQLAHFYSVEFDVRNERILDNTFTGTFENRPLFLILDYMKIVSKIDYSTVSNSDNGKVTTVVTLTGADR